VQRLLTSADKPVLILELVLLSVWTQTLCWTQYLPPMLSTQNWSGLHRQTYHVSVTLRYLLMLYGRCVCQ